MRISGETRRPLYVALCILTLMVRPAVWAAVSTFDQQLIVQSSVAVPETRDFYGGNLAVGDFDGDGDDDLASSAAGEDFSGEVDAGVVLVHYGGILGLGFQIERFVQGEGVVPGTLDASRFFGRSLAAGDFDDDGRDDLAIGADDDPLGINAAGGVTVLYGASEGLGAAGGAQVWSQATPLVPGTAEPGDRFGIRLLVGDFDGNGVDDLAIGATGDSDGIGSVTILFGIPSTGLSTSGAQLLTASSFPCSTSAQDEGFASELAAGDFDADGRDDLAIGVPEESDFPGAVTVTQAGMVIAIPGSPSGLVPGDAVCLWAGAALGGGTVPGQRGEWGYFGSQLAAGDFDRNSFSGAVHDDLAIGHEYGDGAVVVVRGSQSGLTGVGSYGFGVADVPGYPPPTSGLTFPSSLGAARVTGNSTSHDLLVGISPGAPPAIGNALAVIPGSSSGLELDKALLLHSAQSFLLIAPPQTDDFFGEAAAAGDFDDDGFADLVIAARGEDVGDQENAGALLLLYGALFTDNFEGGDTRLWSVTAP